MRPTTENARCVWNALVAFGAPLHGLTVEDFATPGVIFQIGQELGKAELIRNKRASGRPMDLIDADNLEHDT